MTKSLKLVVLGLSLSSSWGNGHATTYRALLRAFAARGHEVVFLERDQSWYAAHRDLPRPDFCRLILYRDRRHLQDFAEIIVDADVAMIGSYVAEGSAIGAWVQKLRQRPTAFYDIDTPVTLAKLASGEVEYISPELIHGYDPYLSFTGGPVLTMLAKTYGSPSPRLLYCTADEQFHRPVRVKRRYDLGYLGTYSADRQPALEKLLIQPARRAPERSFIVAGPQFPDDISWPPNVTYLAHVGPGDHPIFYASCRFALNVTRADMVECGYSPSVRLFEAAACGAPILSDHWAGIDEVFEPNREILLVDSASEVLDIISHMPEAKRLALRAAARRRFLDAHSARQRAAELESHLLDSLRRHASKEPRLLAPSLAKRATGLPPELTKEPAFTRN